MKHIEEAMNLVPMVIERTARGRIATQKSYEHFKLGGIKDGLFDNE